MRRRSQNMPLVVWKKKTNGESNSLSVASKQSRDVLINVYRRRILSTMLSCFIIKKYRVYANKPLPKYFRYDSSWLFKYSYRLLFVTIDRTLLRYILCPRSEFGHKMLDDIDGNIFAQSLEYQVRTHHCFQFHDRRDDCWRIALSPSS